VDNKAIIEELAKQRDALMDIARVFTRSKTRQDDVVQETIIVIMNMNQEVLREIYNKDGIKGLIGYSAIVIRRSLTGKKNRYYYKYRKYYELLSKTPVAMEYNTWLDNLKQPVKSNTNELIDKIEEAMETLYWYDKEILYRYYYNEHTLDSLHEQTGISRGSIFKTVKKARNQIKEKLCLQQKN
jgi:RNA polymerase sigma factor (sigma-70 family)